MARKQKETLSYEQQIESINKKIIGVNNEIEKYNEEIKNIKNNIKDKKKIIKRYNKDIESLEQKRNDEKINEVAKMLIDSGKNIDDILRAIEEKEK
jgi:chromosome segregation ATPase